jgi:HK97 family phage major capsid protein
MITYLSRLTDERDALTQHATGLADKAAEEDRDLTDTEKVSMREWQQRCEQIDSQLAEYGKQAESLRAYARLRGELDTASAEVPAKREARRSEQLPAVQSWGDQFTSSDAFRNYLGMGASARVEVPSPFVEQRAAIDVGTWPGTIPPYFFTPPQFTATTPLLDVVSKVTTGSNSVEWVKWTPNPQTAASIVAEGALKPEANMTATPSTGTLDTYAHWKAITRQALEDIPQIRSIVEGRLRQGIAVALDEAVTDALLADASIPPVTGSAASGDTLLGVIRAGIGTVQANGFATPNAVLLNPADWAALDIAVMVESVDGPLLKSTYWGLRPIAVPSLPAGTAYVGDFTAAVTLFTRGTTALYMTDSHADYFVRNMILLLAEQRALATVPEPMAAAKCTVGAVGTSASKTASK